MSPNELDTLPKYDAAQDAYHHAWALDLERIVGAVPLEPDMRVLDIPCGDGFYSRLLSQRLEPSGSLVAADRLPAYLSRARRRLRHAHCAVQFRRANVYSLPFADSAFDVVWCAQSFISLEDPERAIREIRRVVRGSGVVAILENDVFHHVLLPWPAELEVAIQRAIHSASKKRYGSGSRLAPARWLPRLLKRAGLRARRKKTFAADRQPPWSSDMEQFLMLHLEEIAKLVRQELSPDLRTVLDQFRDRDHPTSIFRRLDADVTCLNVLYLAER